MQHPEEYRQWAHHTATLLKEVDSNHMVTIGSAGLGVRSSVEQVSFGAEHADPSVDFATIQLWPQATDQLLPPHSSSYSASDVSHVFFGRRGGGMPRRSIGKA